MISSSSATLQLRMVVWTTGTAFSERNFTLPTAGGFVDLPFASFTPNGGGADFTNVGALYLRQVENTGAWTGRSAVDSGSRGGPRATPAVSDRW